MSAAIFARRLCEAGQMVPRTKVEFATACVLRPLAEPIFGSSSGW